MKAGTIGMLHAPRGLMSLSTYWAKRNFDRTAEPRGRQSRRSGRAFVVQKHDASRLHYDFRLELDGVFASWAIPKGPSLDPGVKRLAMQTEDHPLDYGDFEGVIPEGEYGGGTVLLWDRGTWQPEGDAEEMFGKGRLTFELHGEKLNGRFHLVRSASRAGKGKKDERSWLFFKGRDDAAVPGSDALVLEERPLSVASGRDIDAIAADPDHVWTSKANAERGRANGGAEGASVGERVATLAKRTDVERRPLPDFVEPQLATLVSEPPGGDDWLHELKLDGYRILARIEAGHAQLFSRRGHDWTTRLPSIASALGRVEGGPGWLDGEVVVLDENGVSNFQRLQGSMLAGRDVGCVYFVFDAPFLGGHDLRGMPLVERKALLAAALKGAPPERLRLCDHVRGQGEAVFARAREMHLEGIVSKRADAPYTSGRGRAWLKIKSLARQELIIVGYTQPARSRGHLGALLLGVRDGERLVYAGKVGTGFTHAMLEELARKLAPLERDDSPLTETPRGAGLRDVRWVEPRLVAEIAFTEWTRDGLIRHGSFQGLREDKVADEVGRELPAAEAVPLRRRSADTKPRATAKSPTTAKTRATAKPPATAKPRVVANSRPAEKRVRRVSDDAKRTTRSAAKRRTEKAAGASTAAAAREGRAPKPSAQATRSSAASRELKRASSRDATRSRTASKSTSPSRAQKPARSAAPRRASSSSRATARDARVDGGLTASRRAAARARPTGMPEAKAASVPVLSLDPSRLEVTHPERILYPEQGITKRDLMIYYARVAPWMLRFVVERPLMLVRCPEGTEGDCFHQKHPGRGMPRAVGQVQVPQKRGPEANLVIHDVEGLIGLIQMGALEIHTWGARIENIECPDQLVLDLDPDDGLPWERVVEAAHALRARLDAHGLTSFLRGTGGKGLHIVTPIVADTPWEEAKQFTLDLASAMVSAEPGRYVATMTKQKRRGKIFIDYLRNGRGATAVASYSSRARAGAPLALPISWEELDGGQYRPGAFQLTTIEKRLARYRDPWADFEDARARLPRR